MAVKITNGSTVHIASGKAAAKNVTVATNAAEAVLTAAAHGLTISDYVVVTSGWGVLNGRVFRVKAADTNTVTLEGADTTNTDKHPAGGGVGKIEKVTGWTQITQITEVSTSGGEQNFAQFGWLEDDFERQLPTTRSAASLSITIGDDPTLPGYQAAAKASDSGEEGPLRIVLKNSSVILFNGYASLNKTPSLTRNEIMTVNMSYAMSGLPTRY